MNRARVDRANDAAAHEEARGPHLPRSPGGLPLLAWVFIVLAIGDLAWFIVNAGLASATSLADLGSYALRVVASVAAVLLPAVLLGVMSSGRLCSEFTSNGQVVSESCSGGIPFWLASVILAVLVIAPIWTVFFLLSRMNRRAASV